MVADGMLPPTNQVIASIAVSVPDVISLLKQTKITPGTGYAAIVLANAFSFFAPVIFRREDQKQSAFTWKRQQYAFMVLPQGCVNFPTLSQYSTCYSSEPPTGSLC